MYATLKFDTEDVYYPPDYRIDDIPGWLAEIMTDVGVRGTFIVFAEKARSMLDRGRTDVLEAMAAHDIASHQMGNVRPLIPEILADKGWADGVQAMREYEDRVAEELRAAFGCDPVAISRHNLYFGPQHVAVGGERGLPYAYGITGVEGTETPTWYAGTLTLPSATTPGFAGFDEIYSCDDAFRTRMKQLDEYLAACAERGVEFVSLFGCHPVKVMARGWIEHYCLVGGLTRTPAELGWRYGVKSQAHEARAKANFRRLCEYLRDHPYLDVVGTAEAARLFSTQPEDITCDELMAYADQLAESGKIVLNRTFSPAELVTGLAESLARAGADGGPPEAVPRRNVLGPTTRGVLGREADSLTHDELVDLCRQLLQAVESDGHLPANVHTAENRVGIAQLAMAAARGYATAARYEKYERIRVPEVPRYPDAAWPLDAFIQRQIGEHWAYALDFSVDKMAEQARLQTWTLKPAWLNPPRGRMICEGRMDA
ncbi:MAG: hypothetical protein ACYS5V_06190 [Planctomycetota bacterium]|jgi:hypothetical protein